MRTLNRPMFRSGGSTGEGITSGLAPRQGYSNGLSAEQIKEIRDQAKELSYQPRRDNSMNQFLIDFGLNLVSGTPKSNIFATAAEAAKDPMATMQKSRSDREAMQYATEADMFKTLIGAQADIMGSEGGKTYAASEIAKRVRILTGNIIDSRAELQKLKSQGVASGVPGSEDTQVNQKSIDELNKKITLDQSELNNLKKSSQYAASMLKSTDFRDGLIQSIMQRLLTQTLPDGTLKYKKGLQDEKLYQDAYQEMLAFLQESETRVEEAEGGRIGYRNAGPVYGSPTIMSKAATDTEVEDAFGMSVDDAAMPEELSGISYEELRARLPREVSDEIVTLLANSAEALEDFAVIQTEQDIANFNKKYGVNLVLPSEA